MQNDADAAHRPKPRFDPRRGSAQPSAEGPGHEPSEHALLVRYQDLISLRMRAGDGSLHPVRDVLVRETDLGAAYVVVDIGGWFEGREVVVGIERFVAPDVRGGEWPARISEDELERKPEPPGGEGSSSRMGPLGGSIGEWLGGGADGAPAPAKPDPRSGETPLRSVGEMLSGVSVAAQDAQAGEPDGRLMGLIFEAEAWTPTHLIVETGRPLPQNQRVVPMEFVEGIDLDGGLVRLNVGRERLDQSPDLHETDWLEGKWYNKLLAYYGLQS